MEESEPFINYNHENWHIPKEFYNSNPESSKRIAKTLSEIGRKIECPKTFNGSEINQTQIFKRTFLVEAVKDRATESNPEEIELDF